MKNSPSPNCTDQVISGLAIVLVAGTLILPFARGAIIGTDSPNAVGTPAPGYLSAVLDTTNLPLPLNNWPVLGPATYTLPGPGSYPFIDPGVGTNQPQQPYRVSWQ